MAVEDAIAYAEYVAELEEQEIAPSNRTRGDDSTGTNVCVTALRRIAAFLLSPEQLCRERVVTEPVCSEISKHPNNLIDSIDADVRVASDIVHAARWALMNDEETFDPNAIANALESVENSLTYVGQEANELFAIATARRNGREVKA